MIDSDQRKFLQIRVEFVGELEICSVRWSRKTVQADERLERVNWMGKSSRRYLDLGNCREFQAYALCKGMYQ